MECIHPRLIHAKDGSRFGADFVVPCGQCLPCRIQRRREWATRIIHELDTAKGIGYFLTLTYADLYLPFCNSLCKKDLQDFWKRYRKEIDPVRIRYYACGEYGSLNERPHYHAIVFGQGLVDLDVYFVGRHRRSRLIDRVWGLGLHDVGTVTFDSAQYVAGYIEKKLCGDMAVEEYCSKGRIPPYSVMSKGIGGAWADANKDLVVDNLGVTIKGKAVGLPRYYTKRLAIDAGARFEAGAEQRERKREKYTEIYSLEGHIGCDEFRKLNAQARYEELKARLALKSARGL